MPTRVHLRDVSVGPGQPPPQRLIGRHQVRLSGVGIAHSGNVGGDLLMLRP